MFFLLDWVRRGLAARDPFPEEWRAILKQRTPFYAKLKDEARERFETKLKVFVRTKHFEGVKGMVIDDEVRVVIAASAARLIMNLPDEHYGRLIDIVVYPSHFSHHDLPGDAVLGQAFGAGTVVLSWDAVIAGVESPRDGHDTALHEFAHALDGADGTFDGTPELRKLEDCGPWGRVMTRAFDVLQRSVGRKRGQLLREYGATNEAEFFAVSTEVFFEKPEQMRARHPDLYRVLAGYYRNDPLKPE